MENFSGPEDTRWAKEVPEGGSEGSTTHLGVPTSATYRTASLLYKYPESPKTLGESTKHNSSHRKFQNHEIQSNTITEGVIILIGASPMMRE